MSEYAGTQVGSAEGIASFLKRQLEAAQPRTFTTKARKATRSRPSTLIVRKDSTIIHGVRLSGAEMNERLAWDRAVPAGVQVTQRHKARCVFAGGAIRLVDTHK